MKEEKREKCNFSDRQINIIKDDMERKIYLRFEMCGNENVAFFELDEVKEIFVSNGVTYNAVIFQNMLYNFLIFWHDDYIMIKERRPFDSIIASIDKLMKNKKSRSD